MKISIKILNDPVWNVEGRLSVNLELLGPGLAKLGPSANLLTDAPSISLGAHSMSVHMTGHTDAL